jgi:signal peptidase I
VVVIVGLIVSPIIVLRLPIGALAAVVVWALPLGVLLGVAISGIRAARAAPVPYQPHRYNRWYIYAGFWLAMAAMTELGVRPAMRAWSIAFRVPSGSMEPTILIGDFIYVAKFSPHGPLPPRETVIVFESVEERELRVLQRVVGVPGDTLAMRQGRLLVNGDSVSEPYAQHRAPRKSESPEYRDRMLAWQRPHLVPTVDSGYSPDISDWGPLTVPPEVVFTLGDNREASYDGRYWGFLPRAHIIGAPRLVYFSYNPFLGRPMPYFTAVRWARIGHRFQ